MTEPTGVAIHDQETDEIRTDLRVIRVLDRGKVRELRLRVGRGVIRDVAEKGEVGT